MPRIIRKWLSCHGQLPGALALPQTMVYCGSSIPHILATNVAHPLISPLLHSLHTPSSLATPPNSTSSSCLNLECSCTTSQFHHHPSVSSPSKPCPFLQIVYFVFFIVPVYMCTNMYVCLLTASPVDPHGMLLV